MRFLSIFFLISGLLFGQSYTPVYGSRDVKGSFKVSGEVFLPPIGAALPATCTQGQTFFKAASPIGLHQCTATNTWTLISAGGSHATSHQHGGADEVATATPAANAIPKAGAGGQLASGWLPGNGYTAAGNQSTSYTLTRTAPVHTWSVTLTGNVTFTASGLVAGDKVTLDLTQDGTGGRVPVLPAGFLGASLVSTVAGSNTVLEYTWNGSAAKLENLRCSGGCVPAFITEAGNVVLVPDAAGSFVTTAAAVALDLSGKVSTKPNKTGTTPPATCAVGETFQDTDATATSQYLVCTAVNTWTAQGAVGGGSSRWVFDQACTIQFAGGTTAWCGSHGFTTIAENGANVRVPQAGTLKNLVLKNVSYNSIAVTCTVRLNAASTTITATIPADSAVGSVASTQTDLVHTGTVAAGDNIALQCTQASGTSAQLWWQVQVE